MHKTPDTWLSAMVLAASLALPAAAWAQGTPPATPSPAPALAPAAPAGGAPAPVEAGTHHRRGDNAADRVEARIEHLRTTLHITAEQKVPWDQFAQVMRDNAQAMSQAFQDRAAKIQTMNAVESMQSYAQTVAQHAQNMQQLASAFQTLYDQLSDKQKKAADIAFRQAATRR